MIFFLDIQGTLIDDQDRMPIEGAREFIDALNEKKIPSIAITNNTKYHSKDFLQELRQKGLDIHNYIDPFMVLKERLKAKRVAAYGLPRFLEIVQDLGYVLDYRDPEAVVVSIKKNYDNEQFSQMIEFLLRGAKLYGMHKTALYATQGKRYPGVGAILEMLRYATAKEYSVVGKPSRAFYEAALQQVGGRDFKDVIIISDDVKGDLVEAKRVGMKTVFVLSGKYRNAEEIVPYLKENERPDMIVPSIQIAGKRLGVL